MDIYHLARLIDQNNGSRCPNSDDSHALATMIIILTRKSFQAPVITLVVSLR